MVTCDVCGCVPERVYIFEHPAPSLFACASCVPTVERARLIMADWRPLPLPHEHDRIAEAEARGRADERRAIVDDLRAGARTFRASERDEARAGAFLLDGLAQRFEAGNHRELPVTTAASAGDAETIIEAAKRSRVRGTGGQG